jgi:hypothetical protein
MAQQVIDGIFDESPPGYTDPGDPMAPDTGDPLIAPGNDPHVNPTNAGGSTAPGLFGRMIGAQLTALGWAGAGFVTAVAVTAGVGVYRFFRGE